MRTTWKCNACKSVFVTEEPDALVSRGRMRRACPRCGCWALPHSGWDEFEKVRLGVVVTVLIVGLMTCAALAIRYLMAHH